MRLRREVGLLISSETQGRWASQMNRLISVVAVVTVILLFASCSRTELRGKSTQSKDGKTYLVVDDDSGGRCGPVKIDGKIWPFALHQAGAITPGIHTISCGEGHGIDFEVHVGTTFHFDYWGP